MISRIAAAAGCPHFAATSPPREGGVGLASLLGADVAASARASGVLLAGSPQRSTPSAEATGHCPLGYGAGQNQATDVDDNSNAPVCPLGFGASRKVLPRLNCCVCKALMHEPVRAVPCEHVFCHGCAAKFRDCPVCGRDIESTRRDHELDKEIDDEIDAMAAPLTTASRTGALVQISPEAPSALRRALGECYAGLQSLRGGNAYAAHRRLCASYAVLAEHVKDLEGDVREAVERSCAVAAAKVSDIHQSAGNILDSESCALLSLSHWNSVPPSAERDADCALVHERLIAIYLTLGDTRKARDSAREALSCRLSCWSRDRAHRPALRLLSVACTIADLDAQLALGDPLCKRAVDVASVCAEALHVVDHAKVTEAERRILIAAERIASSATTPSHGSPLLFS